MIPIIAIANLINGIVSAILMVHLYSHYRRRVLAGIPIAPGSRYFIYLYLVFTILWLLYATPGLLVTNLFLIMVLQSFADVFVYIGAIMGIYISFFALNKTNIGAILSGIVGTTAVFYVIGRVFAPFPHVQETIYPYVYWHPNIPPWMQIMTGVVAAIGSLIFVITFIILGYRARGNKLVFRRSMFLASGMAGLFVASVLFFIYANGSFVSTTLASAMGVGGLLFMVEGISFDEEPEKPR